MWLQLLAKANAKDADDFLEDASPVNEVDKFIRRQRK